jgi:2-phosphosulfolactate phosphatase
MESLDLALLPAEALAIDADCYIVVDVLRATTTIATLFARGMLDLVVCNDIQAARDRARDEVRILFGEVGGLPPEGFDYGNSPVEAERLLVAGKRGVLFTTNGTAALYALGARSDMVVTGALSNAAAVVRFAAGYSRVVLVCAGNGGGTRFSQEDFVAAGAIIDRLVGADTQASLGDAALLARVASRDAGLIATSKHAHLLTSLGLAEDVRFALKADTSQAVPQVAETGTGWALLVDAANR